MATKLGVAPNYFTSFVDGQGVGASNYFAYAQDLDTNFAAIESTVNDLVDEVQAVNGPGALIARDVATYDDSAGPVGQQQNGVIGEHSYEVSIATSTSLDVEPGTAIANAQRVRSDSTVNLVGSGSSGDRWVAIDANGLPSLETSANQKALDIAKVAWDGAQFTAPVLQLAHIFPDGDAWLAMLERPRDGTTWAGDGDGVRRTGFKVFRLIARRIEALERLVTGRNTEADGATLPVPGIPAGSAANPGLVATDGAGTRDATTGWFRQAANVWGFAASGVEKLRLRASGIRAILGSAGTPPYSFIGDGDTGAFSPGANRYAITTAGNRAVEVDELGNVDFVLQTRGEATATAFSLASGAALSSITLDTEVEDVGGSFAPSSADIVVPNGANLRWNAILEVFFDESTSSSPNTGHREVAIQANGVDLGRVRVQAASSGDTRLTTAMENVMGGLQVIRARAAQDSGGAMDIDARITWRKVA